MKKYNVKSIMSRAWAIYHETDKGDGLRPVFSLCLAMAWEDAKNTPENILRQWAAMDTKAQINMLTANIKKAAKNEIGYSTEDHYAEFNETVAWFLNHHGIEGLVNEAWVKLAERLDADYLDKLNAKRAASGKVNISLVALVYRSAKDAIRAVYRDDIKHGRARVHEITDKNGESRDYLDTMASTGKDETASTATLRVALEQFVNSRDEIDRMIIECKRDNYTEREIAEVVGINRAAVHKRIDKMREALRNIGLTPAEAVA